MGVADGCLQLYSFWEPDTGPLNEQQVFISAESPIQNYLHGLGINCVPFVYYNPTVGEQKHILVIF